MEGQCLHRPPGTAGAGPALHREAKGCSDQLLLFPLQTNPHLRRAVLSLGPGQDRGCSSASLKMLQGQLDP